MKIPDKIEWPDKTNTELKADIVAGKMNEVIVFLQETFASQPNNSKKDFPNGLAVVDVYDSKNDVCLHANQRILKNGRKFCEDCRKLVKG